MDADLDTLCTVIYCTADDLLPEARANARRRITDAELVTLCVAPGDHGHPQRPQVPCRRRASGSCTSSRSCPRSSAYRQAPPAAQRTRSSGSWAHFAADSPGFSDDLLLCDSTPVECGRSRETAKRSALGEAAGYGYCAAHTRWYWGFRLPSAGRSRRHAASLHARRSAARPGTASPTASSRPRAARPGRCSRHAGQSPVHPLTWPRSDRAVLPLLIDSTLERRPTEQTAGRTQQPASRRLAVTTDAPDLTGTSVRQ